MLNPPRPSEELVTSLPSPPVVVTGMTDVCGRRQVLLEVGGAGKVVHKPVLEEGAAIEGVRVLGIDVRTACVRLTWNGIEKILPLGTASRGPENVPKPATRQ
jgi:hypothetical protein